MGDVGLGKIGSVDGLGTLDGGNSDSNSPDHSFRWKCTRRSSSRQSLSYDRCGNYHANTDISNNEQNFLKEARVPIFVETIKTKTQSTNIGWNSTSGLLGITIAIMVIPLHVNFGNRGDPSHVA